MPDLASLQLLATAAAGIAGAASGAGAAWALMRYRLDRTERSAAAAHARLDKLEPRVLTVEIQGQHHERQITDGLKRVEDLIRGLNERIDRVLEERR